MLEVFGFAPLPKSHSHALIFCPTELSWKSIQTVSHGELSLTMNVALGPALQSTTLTVMVVSPVPLSSVTVRVMS